MEIETLVAPPVGHRRAGDPDPGRRVVRPQRAGPAADRAVAGREFERSGVHRDRDGAAVTGCVDHARALYRSDAPSSAGASPFNANRSSRMATAPGRRDGGPGPARPGGGTSARAPATGGESVETAGVLTPMMYEGGPAPPAGGAHDGLRRIYIQYENWLRSQSWYTPASPARIPIEEASPRTTEVAGSRRRPRTRGATKGLDFINLVT
jgi:hypothetical protein